MSDLLPAVWSGPPTMASDALPPPTSRARQVADDFLFSYRNPSTRENYAQGLKAWFGFCMKAGVDPLEAQRSLIEKYLLWSEEIDGKARRTVAGRFSAIKGFYRRAMLDGAIDKDPCYLLKAPSVPRKTTTNDLTRVELVRILKMAEKRSERDYAALCLLGYNGLRVSELVGIDIEHFGRDRGFYVVTITRKGGGVQTLALSQETAWAVERCIGDRTNGPLLTSMRTPGKRMARADVQGMVKRYAKLAKVPPNKSISPHSFRHSFVTLSLDAGVSSRDVMNSAGHADPRMTAYYDRNRESLAHNATHTLTAFVEGAI